MIITKSKIGNKILQYFFLNKNAKHYINELARILELDPKNTNSKLKEFEKKGFLKSEFIGRQRYFFLNKDFSLLKQYEEIFLKTQGVQNSISELVKKDKQIKEAYIFGSYAGGKFDDFSDIDIMLVGDHSSLGVQKKVLDIQKFIGREINIVNFDSIEFNKKKNKDPFVINALKNSIKLK